MATEGRDGRSAEEFLREHGAETIDHPGGTLLAHLLRVRDLLAAWGADATVQFAGLCHAAYGTDGFAVSLLTTTERATLVRVIGPEAERLVYLYGSCDRGQAYPELHRDVVPWRDRFTGDITSVTGTDLRAFVEITAANELDVVRHSADIARRFGPALRQLVERTGHHLSPDARRAWSALSLTEPDQH